MREGNDFRRLRLLGNWDSGVKLVPGLSTVRLSNTSAWRQDWKCGINPINNCYGVNYFLMK